MTEFALRCRLCFTHAPKENTVEWIREHGDETHDGKLPDIDLVGVCRCGSDMTFTATVKNKDTYDCVKCRRTLRLRAHSV